MVEKLELILQKLVLLQVNLKILLLIKKNVIPLWSEHIKRCISVKDLLYPKRALQP